MCIRPRCLARNRPEHCDVVAPVDKLSLCCDTLIPACVCTFEIKELSNIHSGLHVVHTPKKAQIAFASGIVASRRFWKCAQYARFALRKVIRLDDLTSRVPSFDSNQLRILYDKTSCIDLRVSQPARQCQSVEPQHGGQLKHAPMEGTFRLVNVISRWHQAH